MAEEGLRIAETVNNLRLIEACEGVSLLYLSWGDAHRAIPLLERALGLCARTGMCRFSCPGGRSSGSGIPWAGCRRGAGAGGTRGGARGRQG